MNKVIAVYETEDDAAKAVWELETAGFDRNDITVYNRDDISNSKIHVKVSHRFELFEIGIGVVIGAALGAIIGSDTMQLPGFSFLYSAGILKGAFVGAIFGLLMSFAIALVTSFIYYVRVVYTSEKHLNAGKYLVFYDGHKRQDIKRAHDVLHTPDIPVELSMY